MRKLQVPVLYEFLGPSSKVISWTITFQGKICSIVEGGVLKCELKQQVVHRPLSRETPTLSRTWACVGKRVPSSTLESLLARGALHGLKVLTLNLCFNWGWKCSGNMLSIANSWARLLSMRGVRSASFKTLVVQTPRNLLHRGYARNSTDGLTERSLRKLNMQHCLVAKFPSLQV